MLLRPAISLLESSAGPSQLRPVFSCFERRLTTGLTQPRRTTAERPRKRGVEHTLDRLSEESAGSGRNGIKTRETVHDGRKKLLSPYDLSLRVGALCQAGDYNGAISLVKQAPLGAQNAVVWANLIHPILEIGRYQEAYRLFTDMKRRGIRPTSRTYGTLLKGYFQIDDWDKFPLQLNNVCSLYDQVKQHHADVQLNGGPESELSNIPYNLLIRIFGNAQNFQRMYDVFNAMPAKGPLAPDIHTFTALITAISGRQLSALPIIPSEAGSSPPSMIELAYKNASDVKLLWRQLLRVCQCPDSHAIRAVLKPLSRGRPSDQNFALDIVHEYLGLSRPGEQTIPAKLALHEHTLEYILQTCNQLRRYRFTLHYVQQVIDSDRSLLLNRRHMDLALEAHAALAPTDPGESEQAVETLQWMLRMQALPPAPRLDGGIGRQIRPGGTTYDLVALACWYSGDWVNACRTFELMTGFASEQFRGQMQEPLKPQPQRHGLTMRPSAGFMSSFIRTAAKTHDLENIRQTLNVLEHYGLDTVLDVKTGCTEPPGSSRRRESDQAFYSSKLIEALSRVLPSMLRSANYDHATKARWRDILRRAEGKEVS